MRIDVFTPLPDLRTEIANMSASVLPELGRIAQVRAWTAQPDWREGLEDGYEIRRFDPHAPPIREINRADVTFYNLGNDARFHRAIFDVARRVPGIHILHDVRLAHFFGSYAAEPGPDRMFYLDEMAQAGLRREAEEFIADRLPFEELASRNPMTAAALRPAIGGIVHNPMELAAVADASAVPLHYVPLCLPGPLLPAPPGTGFPPMAGRPARLVVFGFIGRNRRLADVLQAMARLPNRKAYTLDIYGILQDPGGTADMIRQLGLQEQVIQHGFVSDQILEAALRRSDLAINLRNPTMGEASGSQLRIWANALPSLVSDVSWYSTLSRDAVFHVAPGREIDDLVFHLQAIREVPDRFRAAGARGRLLLERHHRPADYARALLRIAEQAPAMHARRTALRLAARSSARMAQATGGRLAGDLVAPVARRIHDLTGHGT